jgi:hypothetical protein
VSSSDISKNTVGKSRGTLLLAADEGKANNDIVDDTHACADLASFLIHFDTRSRI